MKQKDPVTKNQRYLAVFLALTMLLSAGAIFFSGNSNKDKSDNASSSGNLEENNTIAFSQIPGRQVHHEFNSIADGLNMSPEGVVSASYVDLQRTTGTPFEQFFGNQTIMYSLYGADVTKRYGARYADGNGFELHQIPERKMIMPWGAVQYDNYSLLARTNNTYDIWNVAGSPVILGSRQSVQDVIDVLQGNATASTEYNNLLSQANTEGSLYQELTVKTNNSTLPADQRYMDIKKLDDGSYSQTFLYLNPESNFTDEIKALQANSTERGVTYNVTTSGNITKMMITSDFRSLLNETEMLSQ
ncbi:hypothetical protein MSKOL_0930 [Methanosarcina sp. Kolksee]|uniref:hypothetical protein n=1 Tax=Methanosarcina sp. Kolksee TaxID=1434099 RepID=UPI0006156B23|nr:hypothetical protein [Methanosarcina sp. Kolksee]AKB46707.1 hypothetical protein MSKOL_0930 [Methanosarcina sp. Kolksee]